MVLGKNLAQMQEEAIGDTPLPKKKSLLIRPGAGGTATIVLIGNKMWKGPGISDDNDENDNDDGDLSTFCEFSRYCTSILRLIRIVQLVLRKAISKQRLVLVSDHVLHKTLY